jgi:hypothetical protein
MALIHTYKFSIPGFKVFSLFLGISLFNVGCACNKHKDHGSSQGNPTSSSIILVVKEVDTTKGSGNYVTIGIKSQELEDDLNQYFVSAQVLEGQGSLLAAQEKVSNKFQYKIPLQTEQCMGKLLPMKGDASIFKEGKQFKIKCKYEPAVGSKPGEKHCLLIKVSKQDSEGKVIQEEQTEISLIIKNVPKSILVVKEVDSTKGSENYLTIGIKTQELGDDLNQYFVSAQALEGQGSLLATQEKQHNRFQYKVLLQAKQCMGQLLPEKGDVTIFKEGKQLKFKCKYKPGVGSKPGEKHRLLIKVSKQDSEGKVVQEEQAAISLIIKDAPKALVVVKEVDATKGSEHYLTIGIKPQELDEDINQYFVSAQALEGQGSLLATQEKQHNKFQYKVPLQDKQCMGQLLPEKGDASVFKEGKQFKIKCKYEPAVGSKPGEKHRLLIKVSKQDSKGKVIQEEQTEASITIKQGTKLLVVVRELDPTKGSEHYLTIGIKSQELGDDLNQYFVSAQVLEGQGSVLAAQEKQHNKFQYKIPLQAEQCVGKLLPMGGDVSMFKEGKQFKIKCKYAPGIGSKVGDIHQIAIIVSKQGGEGHSIQEEQVKIPLVIKKQPELNKPTSARKPATSDKPAGKPEVEKASSVHEPDTSSKPADKPEADKATTNTRESAASDKPAGKPEAEKPTSARKPATSDKSAGKPEVEKPTSARKPATSDKPADKPEAEKPTSARKPATSDKPTGKLEVEKPTSSRESATSDKSGDKPEVEKASSVPEPDISSKPTGKLEVEKPTSSRESATLDKPGDKPEVEKASSVPEPDILSKPAYKNPTFKKHLVTVKEIDTEGPDYYMTIEIKPQEKNTHLDHYFLSVETLAGEGILLGAQKEEYKINSQYEFSVDEEQCLAYFFLMEGTEAEVSAGNQIKFDCKYEPETSAKQGDIHQLLITVRYQDSEKGIMEEVQSKLDITIK